MSLSLDHYPTSIGKFASQWRTVHYLAHSTGVLKCLKFLPLNVGMYRRMRACTDEFLAMVIEGVVHSVYKVVTQSSFSVVRRHKVSESTWMFRHCDTRCIGIFNGS